MSWIALFSSARPVGPFIRRVRTKCRAMALARTAWLANAIAGELSGGGGSRAASGGGWTYWTVTGAVVGNPASDWGNPSNRGRTTNWYVASPHGGLKRNRPLPRPCRTHSRPSSATAAWSNGAPSREMSTRKRSYGSSKPPHCTSMASPT